MTLKTNRSTVRLCFYHISELEKSLFKLKLLACQRQAKKPELKIYLALYHSYFQLVITLWKMAKYLYFGQTYYVLN